MILHQPAIRHLKYTKMKKRTHEFVQTFIRICSDVVDALVTSIFVSRCISISVWIIRGSFWNRIFKIIVRYESYHFYFHLTANISSLNVHEKRLNQRVSPLIRFRLRKWSNFSHAEKMSQDVSSVITFMYKFEFRVSKPNYLRFNHYQYNPSPNHMGNIFWFVHGILEDDCNLQFVKYNL